MRHHYFNASDDSNTRRDELVRRIERALADMTLPELEALSYDMLTKGYLDKKSV